MDINVLPGDLIIHQTKVPTRLNPSFGAITYADNDRYGNYESIYLQLERHVSRVALSMPPTLVPVPRMTH